MKRKTSNKTKKSNVKDNAFSTFIGYVKKSNANEIQEIRVNLSKPIEELTYDEVEFAIANEFNMKNSSENILGFELLKITIIDQDDPSLQWPVFHEYDPEIEVLKKMSTCKKFLILPNALYSLTPECKLWMKLVDEGIMSKKDKFDFDKMHRLLDCIIEKQNPNRR